VRSDVDSFFTWLKDENVGDIIKKHNRFGIDALPYRVVITVTTRCGDVFEGDYGYWTNAFRNRPKGESIFILEGEEECEVFVDCIVSIQQIGNSEK